MSVSVVIPAYNEAERIRSSLANLRQYLEETFRDWEIIVVDDGSRDGTAKIVQDLQSHWPNLVLVSYPENRGKGYAVRRGALKARKDLVLITDADLACPIRELDRLMKAMGHADVGAIGSREIPSDGCQVRDRWLRRLSGRIFNLTVRRLVLGKYRDTQCGFKLFRRKPLREIAKSLHVEGFCFDVEMLVLAKKLNYPVKEVAVNWSHQPGSKVHLFSDAFKMVRDIFLIKKIHG